MSWQQCLSPGINGHPDFLLRYFINRCRSGGRAILMHTCGSCHIVLKNRLKTKTTLARHCFSSRSNSGFVTSSMIMNTCLRHLRLSHTFMSMTVICAVNLRTDESSPFPLTAQHLRAFETAVARQRGHEGRYVAEHEIMTELEYCKSSTRCKLFNPSSVSSASQLLTTC
jgi:hypothetical protein